MLQFKVIASVGAVFATICTLVLWMQGTLTPPRKAKTFTHMHCPTCGLEMEFNPLMEGKKCPQCGPTGVALVSTIGPTAGRNQSGPGGVVGNVIVAILISSVASMGVVYAWVQYFKAQKKAEEDLLNETRIVHCPHCERKIGFPARKVGTAARCPRCQTVFPLPEGIPEEVL